MSIKPLLEKIEKYRADREAKKDAERVAIELNAHARMQPILDLIPDMSEFASYTQQPYITPGHSVEWELRFGQKALLRTREADAWVVTVFTPAGTPHTEAYGKPENAVKYLVAALVAKSYEEIDELYLKALSELDEAETGERAEPVTAFDVSGQPLGVILINNSTAGPGCAKCHAKFLEGEQTFPFTYRQRKPNVPFQEDGTPSSPDDYENRLAALCHICNKIVFPETGPFSMGVVVTGKTGNKELNAFLESVAPKSEAEAATILNSPKVPAK